MCRSSLCVHRLGHRHPLWSKEMFVSRSTESIFGSDRSRGNALNALTSICAIGELSIDRLCRIVRKKTVLLLIREMFFMVKTVICSTLLHYSWKGFGPQVVFVSIWWVNRGVLQIVVVNVFGFRLNIVLWPKFISWVLIQNYSFSRLVLGVDDDWRSFFFVRKSRARCTILIISVTHKTRLLKGHALSAVLKCIGKAPTKPQRNRGGQRRQLVLIIAIDVVVKERLGEYVWVNSSPVDETAIN